MSQETHHQDVIIIGAGISGVSAACHLQKNCPSKSYVILEARNDLGGTWDLFRYPGIRSDSDMFTLGFGFRPWRDEKAIAEGPLIKKYIADAARAYGIGSKIRFGRSVRKLSWSSERAEWAVTVECEGATNTFTAPFVIFAAGYYKYDAGHAPAFDGADDYQGEIIHPQHWPEDLDYAGKQVVVIGSGATAVTIVPALAETAAHVTMLQRSPSYYFSMPAVSGLSKFLNRVLPSGAAHFISRWLRIILQQISFKFARAKPEKTAKNLIKLTKDRLPEGYDVKTHFTPRYNPWEQRLCVVPDDDLFDAIKRGRASVVTDSIDAFDREGVILGGGERLPADIIVTATGLELESFGGAEITVDGSILTPGDLLAYKGFMFDGVPNLVSVSGYTNASWTLRADLINAYACRLINHLDKKGFAFATPVNADPDLIREPIIDFNSGYVTRAVDRLPKQGAVDPWRNPQDYFRDLRTLRFGKLEDGVLQFSKASTVSVTEQTPAEARIA